MSGSRWWILAVTLLALFAAGCGCGDDDDDDSGADDDTSDDDTSDDDDVDDDDVDDDADDDLDDDSDTIPPEAVPFINAGKDWLKIGEGDKARVEFEKALEIDAGIEDAQYGMVLGNLLRHFDILSILIDYILSLEWGGPVKAESPDNWLDSILEELLTGLGYTRSEELIGYAQSLDAMSDPDFELDSMPVILHFEEVTRLGTDFDRVELLGSSALSRLMMGLFHHLTAVSIDIDISYAFVILDIFDRPWDTVDQIGATVNVLLDMFQDPSYPDFLTLPPANVAELQAAGLSIGDGADDALRALATLRAETDDQSDDVIGFVDVSGDGFWNFDEHLVVPGVGELSDEQMAMVDDVEKLFTDMRAAFWDQTAKDLDPDEPNLLPLADFNVVLNWFGLPAIIPDIGLTRVDVGSMYADPGHDEFKQTLITILNIADIFLPDPPL